MEQKTLKTWQAERISKALYPGMNYLIRLRERMVRVGFIPSDKLYQLVNKAYDAMHSLSVEMHYQSCKRGVGRPEKE